MRASKKPSKNMQKGARKMRRRERTLRAAPPANEITSEGGTSFSVGPNFEGEVSERGVPTTYRLDSPEIDEKGFQHLLRYLPAMKEWNEKGGQQWGRPFRYEYSMRPKGIGSNPTDRNMQLAPMSAIRRLEGRKPEIIMRANDRMKSGQEPDYYKVWDEKRNQWSTRPVETEELDRYRQENRVFKTPSIRF